ncbi:MAG: asparaginyl-tRNA synthetase [Luteibaculaceae bacterium]|jgi:asparaginyl-tRNA synthetase
MARLQVKDLLEASGPQADICIQGWVRTKRGSKNVSFIALNDGSTIHNIQIVVEGDTISEEIMKKVATGAALKITGNLQESQGSGQKFEIIASDLIVLGESDPDEYPLQPKKHSMEFLREKAHLRFRTNTFSAVFRIRHAMSFAVHKFFNDRGFFNMHTPIITGSDAEGAGEMFRVTTLDLNNVPKNEDGGIDTEADFFGKETNLTVSGQLEAELGAMALGKVYTFGPTFRAENSNTTRHLAEFWMIEPEVAFNNLADNMDLAEEFLKYLCSYALENCADDVAFLNQRSLDEEKSLPQDKRNPLSLEERLNFVAENGFKRVPYTEAIDILRNSKPYKKGKFEYDVEWGVDLQSEHERFLVEKHFNCPVILFDYPEKIKAFYMRRNDDGKTVAAMDVLFPGIGEIIGGSQREERLDVLKEKIAQFNIPEEHVWWYMDTRRFGTAEHSGFGLGFERLVQFVTGMGNIRDVIPFPRAPQSANF